MKAGELSKTVKVTQAGKTADPTPEPEPEAKTYILVGEAVGGWDPTNNGVILTLKDGYYTAKSVAVAAKKGMHFTKNSSWEGNVKGLHGLIAPNEIGEVGSNDISLTEGGNFDVYLTEALDKFYFMSEGKLPSEAVQHQEIAVTWGVIGATKSGAWSTDYVMTQEGEWYVAKAVEFAEVNLKVRGNSSWADDVKWGRAAQDTECKLNAAIAVSTCTEYKAANPSEGDNPNIYVGGEGTYDVYFSPDKKEVWIMTPGYKPGDEVPETPSEPEKETAELVTFLSFTSNLASGQNTVTVQLAAEGLSMESVTSEWGTYDQLVGSGKYLKFDAYSADGTLAAGTYNASAVGGTVNEGEFSIGYDTTVDWGWGPMEMTNWGTCWMTHNADGSETGVKITDGTITVAVEGDVYTITIKSSVLEATYVGKLSKDAGETPENPEPGQPELEVSDWNIVGSFTGGWNPSEGLALSVLDENYFVYYGLELAADAQWKFLQGTSWGSPEVGANRSSVEPNTIQAKGGTNIYVNTPGKYDIYLAADASKFYVMSEGKTPAEATEPSAAVATYTVTGTLQGQNWNNMAAEGLMAQEGAYYVAKNVPFTTAAALYGGADQIEFKICNTGSWDGAYGAAAEGTYNANAEIAVAVNGGNIAVTAPAGAYDVYFDKENGKTWVMTPGSTPGDAPSTPDQTQITELYMLGGACDTGWSLDNMTAFTFNGSVWVWEGNLKIDAFRFPLQKVSNQWWPCLVPNADGTAVTYETTDVDNTYRVPAEGYYKVTVNAETYAMTVEHLGDRREPAVNVTELYMLGSACDTGWSLDDMTAFENNNGIFTWTGNLKAGEEFRFPLQKVSNGWWPCLMISADGTSLVYGQSDNDKVVYHVANTGVYTITVDVRDWYNRAVTIVE